MGMTTIFDSVFGPKLVDGGGSSTFGTRRLKMRGRFRRLKMHLDFKLSQPKIPGHALHEKGLQRQIGDGTLVSSQKRRAAVVPRINRR